MRAWRGCWGEALLRPNRQSPTSPENASRQLPKTTFGGLVAVSVRALGVETD